MILLFETCSNVSSSFLRSVNIVQFVIFAFGVWLHCVLNFIQHFGLIAVAILRVNEAGGGCGLMYRSYSRHNGEGVWLGAFQYERGMV